MTAFAGMIDQTAPKIHLLFVNTLSMYPTTWIITMKSHWGSECGTAHLVNFSGGEGT